MANDELLDVAKKYVEDTYRNAADEMEKVKGDLKFIKAPRDISDYPRYITALEGCQRQVLKLRLNFSEEAVKSAVLAKYDVMLLEHTKKEVAVSESFEKRVNAIEDRYTENAKAYNDSVRQQVNEENKIYLQLEQKRRELERYKDEVISVCEEYGVTSADVNIDSESFSPEELDSIYDSYISYMSTRKTTSNPISRFRDFTRDNWIVEGIVLLTVILVSFTRILNFLSIGFILGVIVNQQRAKKVVKSYSVLMGLIFNVNPLAMGFSDEVDASRLLDETLNEDNAPELQELADAWANALDELDKENPKNKYGDIETNFQEFYKEVNKKMEYYESLWEPERMELEERIKSAIEKARVNFEEEKKKVTLLGHRISNSPVFDTKFKLGLKEGILEEAYDLGLRNIIIYPKVTPEYKAFLQVMFANALCNVRPGCLTTYIYDPNNFGQDLVGFYTEDMQDCIRFENESLEPILDELKSYAETNMKLLRGQDITAYNEKALSVGKTTRDYKLLIILSQPKKVEEDEALRSFMAYSARYGVLVWLVSNNELSNTKVFKKPFDGVTTPYRIDLDTFADNVNKTWTAARKNLKEEGLPWAEFQERAIPEDKWWTWHSDKFVDLDPGFWEGDPSRYEGYQIGHEGNVHALAVGTTGAGKSVFLNQLIMNMCFKYSPRDVELWLVDYKGSEFSFYLSTPEHPKALPHIKACLCTSDGDYAGSLYTAIREEAQRRYDLLKLAGYKDMYHFNEDIRKGILYTYQDTNGDTRYKVVPDERQVQSGMYKLNEDDLLSRIIFINDEFQVIFEKASPDIVEKIRKDITYISKVARAAGVHLLFTSQSMKGTLSGDVLNQFSLRFALRCDAEVSKEIMGTTFASEIKQKFGYLYVRSYDDKSKEAQKRYRTPFLSDGELRKNIEKLYDMAEEKHIPKHDVISYLESEVHRVDEIDQFFMEHENVWQPGMILLGSRMTYSTNKAPENIVLSAVNNSHIMSCFEDTTDIVNFYKSLRRNLERDEKATLFVNSQVADLHYLCEVDKDMPEQLQFMSNEKCDVGRLYSFFFNVFDMRRKSGKKDDPCYYFLIGWDKAIGFGIDRDYSLTGDFATLLQLCGEYNMHFIFINTNAKGIAPAIINACNIRICGKCNEDSSYAVIENKVASKIDDTLKNGYMYLNKMGAITRCKIYQSILTREIKKTELVL